MAYSGGVTNTPTAAAAERSRWSQTANSTVVAPTNQQARQVHSIRAAERVQPGKPTRLGGHRGGQFDRASG